MKAHSISLVTPHGCDACCPYCISRMTDNGAKQDYNQRDIFRNLAKALLIAREGGAMHVIITGKGEPLLYPEVICTYMQGAGELKTPIPGGNFNFPFIEIQTNGLLLGNSDYKLSDIWDYMRLWYRQGATHVAISVAHYDVARNREIYCPDKAYPQLLQTVARLHEIGYTVRLNCIMVAGFIDSPEELYNMLQFCEGAEVDQLSIRPVTVPANCQNKKIQKWTERHQIHHDELKRIYGWVKMHGTRILRLPYGDVYDIDGQNLCMTDCMTFDEAPGEVRQLIYMPDGSVRYSWQHEGAILLR